MRITRWRASAGISGVQVLRAAAQAVHADDGVALAFVLDGASRRSVCSVMARPQLEPVLDGADAVDLDAHHVAGAAASCGGLKPMPTPAGVPVAMTSPG